MISHAAADPRPAGPAGRMIGRGPCRMVVPTRLTLYFMMGCCELPGKSVFHEAMRGCCKG
eukprot:743455-Hanusia_phi.AAC.2